MSVNSSSSLNVTLVPTPFPSSIPPLYINCQKSVASDVVFSIYTFTNLLLLPLYILVLYIGFQRWRHQSSVPAGQKTSHSDFFTYHLIVMEIWGVSGSLIYCVGLYTNSEREILLGALVSSVIFPGQTLFHSLTCVERYLAVVHPVTYMRLRDKRGARFRNVSILCTWLLCFGWVEITYLYMPNFPAIPLLCIVCFSLIVISFCSLSVLRVVIRPGPGEVGGDRERVDQSKQRALHIIRAILGALLLRLAGLLVCCGITQWSQLTTNIELCALVDAGLFLGVPSSLVMPLLFLHKTGKLACCRCNTESG